MARRDTEAGSAKPAGRISIRQVRSAIGYDSRQRKVLAGLGLGRIGKSVKLEDTPSIRGMCAKVSHLVEIEEEAK